MLNNDLRDEILIALRRVVRAIDLHSKHLVQRHGLTSPQALVLKETIQRSEPAIGEVAAAVSLSQATVTDIVKRLETRNLVERHKSADDRRRVLLRVTDRGKRLLNESVPLLQERFIERYEKLEQWEQTQLLASLQRIASLMDAEEIDASPVLSSGSITPAADQGSPASLSLIGDRVKKEDIGVG